MYVGIFKITSDGETAVLRVDLTTDGGTAIYQLQDSTGEVHEFKQSFENDTGSKTYIDRACMAILTYLCDCQASGWTGEITLVQSGIGIPASTWHEFLNLYLVHCSTTKPDGVALQ